MIVQEQNLNNDAEIAMQNIGIEFDETIIEHVSKFVEIFDESKRKLISKKIKTEPLIGTRSKKKVELEKVKEIET